MTAFKTTSMRIRGTSVEELEEAGLATDGLIESTAKLQSQIKALSGVDIMIDSETYKSTYQIMLEIAKVWDNISDINQAALLEALAGKRNSQVLMSVIQNLDDLTGSYEAAQNAAGAMEEANAIAMDTITGKTKALSASWQELSGNLLDSELIKGFMDLARAIVEGVNWIVTAGDGAIATFLAFAATVSGLANMLPALVGGFTKLKSAFDALKAAGLAATAGPVGGALLGWVSAPHIMVAVGLIAALGTAAVYAYKQYKKLNPTLDELKEKAADAKSALEETQSALDENRKRIVEIESLKATGESTLADEDELQRLREENRLLAVQLQLRQDAADDAASDESAKAFEDANAFFNDVEGQYILSDNRTGGYIENATGAEALLLKLAEYQASYDALIDATDAKDEKAIAAARERREALRSQLEETLGTLQSWKASLNVSDPEQVALGKKIQELIDQIAVGVGTTSPSELVHEVIQRDEKAYSAIMGLASKGKLTEDALIELYKGDSAVREVLDYLAKNGHISLGNLGQIADDLNNIAAAAEDTSISLSSMIDDVKDKLDTLYGAQEEMGEAGVLSLDTIQKLSNDSQLKGYLVQTANGYKLATGAVDDFKAAQIDLYATTLNEAKAAAANVIAQQTGIAESVGATTDEYIRQMEVIIAEERMLRSTSAVTKTKGTVKNSFTFEEARQASSTAELDEWDMILRNLKSAKTNKDQIQSLLNSYTKTKTAEGDDKHKESAELQLRKLKHQFEMNEISAEQYYDGLQNILNAYYKDSVEHQKKYAEEIMGLEEEIYNGRKELLDDWINDQNKAAERFARAGNVTDQLAVYKGIIAKVQSAIDQAYADGLDANSDYVQSLEDQMQEAAQRILDITKSVFDDFISYADDFNRWDNFGKDLDISKIEMLRAKLKSIQKLLDDGTISWEDYLDAYNETAKSLYDTQKESIETIIDLTMALIEQEAEDEIEALEDQADAYDELIEKKKELLEKADDEADHEKKVAEAVREIAKLQSKISQLSLDDSREAAAQKAKLEEELYQKQLELADLQGDYALEQTLETLDKAQEANKETVDAEKEAIEKSIDTWVKKYEQAIDRIDNDWDGLYKDLLDYQEEYRDSIDGIDSFEAAWRNVEDTIIDVNENIADSISSTIKGIEDIYQAIENVGINPGTPNLNEDGSWDGTVSGGSSSTGSNKYSSLVSSKGRSIVQKMYNNSVKAAANPSLRDTLNQQNYDYAADYYWATGDELYYNEPSGTWHIGDSYNDPFLYEVYGLKKYHTGGYVGDEGAINDREVLSVLEKGELVLTKGHQFNLKQILSDMYAIVKAMTSINLPSFSTSATSPNGNFNANVEVNITHNGSMTDDDAKRYGSIAGDAALKKLYAAFNKRGIR